METKEVLDIYKSSVENYNIRYNPFIGDGDSSCRNWILLEFLLISFF